MRINHQNKTIMQAFYSRKSTVERELNLNPKKWKWKKWVSERRRKRSSSIRIGNVKLAASRKARASAMTKGNVVLRELPKTRRCD